MNPVIVIGGGGHAKVLIDSLQAQLIPILGFTDISDKQGKTVLDVPFLGSDDQIYRYSPSEVELVNGIGSVVDASSRRQVFEAFKQRGYRFAAVIHPSAIVSRYAQLGEGVQVMAGAIIQPGTVIGANTILNTKASLDHDCHIGQHVHVAPGATLCGQVRVEDHAHVGAGATVLQGVTIGQASIVGAGAVVTQSVPQGITVVGVPARELSKG
ncbi:acetyltransferase [Brevibacillus humidisoli]|uniref:acetyltransferase n=1 Tax=Brevibacillus humidisoli TaxID=2895522 RepID=UPI001E4107EA|nr:acetyltransferase [Brevibacillus humidisoli]UFJ40049.1 acetyltransferase [Brevibacillus humidisoli]